MASKSLRGVLRGRVPEDGFGTLEAILVGLQCLVHAPTLDVDRIVLESLLEYDVGLGEDGAVADGGIA